MKRKTSKSLVSKWKQVFSNGREMADIASDEIPPNNDAPNQTGTALVLIKKEPVTFRLLRRENPLDFDRMLFVIKAVAMRGADFPFKSVLHVERTRSGSRLVATDGLRLHVAEISKRIKSGEYKPHVTKDVITLGEPVEGIRFPHWNTTIPEKTEKRGVINLTETGLGKNRKETEKLSLAFNSFVKQTGEPVNLRYLEDLTKCEWVVFCQDGKRRAIVLRERHGGPDTPDDKGPVAVIMPIPQAA